MSEELKPAAVHDANVFLPGSLGPVRREVVLAYEHDRVVDQLRAELAALKAGQGEAVAEVLSNRIGNDTATIDKALWPGTKLYAAPPVSADARLVPVELLHAATRLLESYQEVIDNCHSSELERFDYQPEVQGAADELRALLAQSESRRNGNDG